MPRRPGGAVKFGLLTNPQPAFTPGMARFQPDMYLKQKIGEGHLVDQLPEIPTPQLVQVITSPITMIGWNGAIATANVAQRAFPENAIRAGMILLNNNAAAVLSYTFKNIATSALVLQPGAAWEFDGDFMPVDDVWVSSATVGALWAAYEGVPFTG